MLEMSSFSLLLEETFSDLSLPLAMSTLNRTPLVQNTIDECLPPLLSNLICNIKYDLVIVQLGMCNTVIRRTSE